ncbi:MAG TPA: class II glutamine amidotransferase [Kofleriaceae bacterium]|jgi:glutamine amidotransferase
MKLIACICNQPQRLAAALEPVRAALVAQPPVSRWGLGYVQGGDVLLVRTPKASATPVDLAGPLLAHESDLRTDCAIALAVGEAGTLSGTDNTPPFRFRRWLYAHTGWGAAADEHATPKLLERVPEYLRRNIRGRTAGEVAFHVFLAALHDTGALDDANISPALARRALANALQQIEAAGAAPLGTVALTNGRCMVVAHGAEPLRVRRLWVMAETGRAERDESFRGFLLVTGPEAEAKDGFEDVPANKAVEVSRDLSMSFADLRP